MYLSLQPYDCCYYIIIKQTLNANGFHEHAMGGNANISGIFSFRRKTIISPEYLHLTSVVNFNPDHVLLPDLCRLFCSEKLENIHHCILNVLMS